ncbi:MAG: CpXC domain-containing protein [Pseudomonadota bacterium]
MSLFHPLTVKCPNCEAEVTVEAVGSVNADRRPDFRDAILEDAFQDTTCGACETSFRLQPEFNYLDAGRGQWIAAMPAPDLPRYLELEDVVTDLFERSYGAKAPRAARDVGDKLAVRLTFGWPGIREKLLVGTHGLDDVVLEMMKLDLLRTLPSAPLGPGVELRLVDVTDENLGFCWIRSDTEEGMEQFTCPRAWYDGIAANTDGWDSMRAQLTNGSFVDMQKLYMGAGRAAAE